MKMNKISVGLLAAIVLTAGSSQVQAKPPSNQVTIDFTSLTFTDINSLNLLLAADGVTVSAGLGTVSGGSGNPLSAPTDPSAIDLLFNFSGPVEDVDLSNADLSGNAVGMTAYNVNTDPVSGLALDNTSADIGGFTSTAQPGFDLNFTGIESVGIEDIGSFAEIDSLTFVPTPEPATFALLALGGAALAGARLRRQKSQ